MRVIKIGAKWCSGCIIMGPRWEEIEGENPWLETEYLDFDEDQEEVARWGVKEDLLPVFIFLDNEGKELKRMRGEKSKKEIVEFLKNHRD